MVEGLLDYMQCCKQEHATVKIKCMMFHNIIAHYVYILAIYSRIKKMLSIYSYNHQEKKWCIYSQYTIYMYKLHAICEEMCVHAYYVHVEIL